MTAVDAADQVFVSDAGTSLKKADIAAIAKYIVENYAGSTIGGSAQSVQAAIGALNSRTDGAYNVRIMTSTNGSFAGLCNADGTYAVYVNDANGKYCYGQFTIMAGKSYDWVTVSNDTVSHNASNNQGTIVFTGGTAPYTAKVVRQTYIPSNATVEGLNSRTTVTNGANYTNLNDLKSTAIYSYDTLSTGVQNAPATGTYFNGMLYVTYYHATKSAQVFISASGAVWTRCWWDGTWRSWTKLATQSDIDALSARVSALEG